LSYAAAAPLENPTTMD